MTLFGVAKLTLLKRLKISQRNSIANRSVIWVFFARPKSKRCWPGPRRMFRPRLPKPRLFGYPPARLSGEHKTDGLK